MLGKIAGLGILLWGVVALLTVIQYARNVPAPQAVLSDACSERSGEFAAAEIRVVRGTIKTVTSTRLVLETCDKTAATYTFDLSTSIVRRGNTDTTAADLLRGETVGVLYIESGGTLTARMILAPRD